MATPVQLDPASQRQQDEQHLRYLALTIYVFAAFILMVALVMAALLLFGGLAALSEGNLNNEELPMAGAFGAIFGVIIIGIPMTIAALQLFFARSLQTHRRYMFCMIMAGLTCLSIPIGTVIGILTLLVLMRPSVKQLFEQTSAMPPQGF